MRKLTSVSALIVVALFGSVQAQDTVSNDEFIVDPPTLHCLGFRWYIDGDDDGDASAAMTYREAGSSTWRDALPMLRVQNEVVNRDFEPFTCENLFAGSILGLEPDTEYEVRIVLTDPDGGSGEQQITVRTRATPQLPDPISTVHVYPSGYAGTRESPSAATVASAVAAAGPGHHIVLHAGVHQIGPNGVRVTTDGSAEAPIVFRGAGDGEAIVDAQGATSAFDIIGTDNLWFEGLTIRNALWGIRANTSSGLSVVRCHIEGTEWAVSTFSELSNGWYIADNDLVGSNESWYPRQDSVLPSYTGINVYGQGHVICFNRITKFWDGIAIADHNKPVDDRALQCVAIDFYNNDISDAIDDGIESDYGCHNIRIFNNRIFNVHTALSAQPTYGGPIYFIRNVAFGVTSLNLKLHNYCTGLEIYHNTLVTAGQAFQSFKEWQNGTLRNNLLLGGTRYAVETGSPHPRTSLDYNGYRRASTEQFYKWWNGTTEGRYQSLEAVSAGTGHETHSVIVDFGIFFEVGVPVEGTTYSPDDIDLRLSAGTAAVDAGILLPTVNEDFRDGAPDLGAYEIGATTPHYGPRAVSVETGSTDFDGSGRVDFADFLLFAGAFGSSTRDERYEARFDLDGSNRVDFADFLLFAGAFGKAASRPTLRYSELAFLTH